MAEPTIKKCYLVFNVGKNVLKEDGAIVGLGQGLGYTAIFYTDLVQERNAADAYAKNNTSAGLVFEVMEAHLTPILPMQVIRAEATLS